MLTPEEAKTVGLRGTLYWKKLVEEIDSSLCAAEGKGTRVYVDPQYVPLVIKEYGEHWSIRNLGSGMTSAQRLDFKPKEMPEQ
jgi:hypothetical protein